MAHNYALKSVAILVAAGTLVSIAGCGNSSDTVNGLPNVTVLVEKNSNQVKMSQMKWANDLEKDCKCHITWQEVSDNQFGCFQDEDGTGYLLSEGGENGTHILRH